MSRSELVYGVGLNDSPSPTSKYSYEWKNGVLVKKRIEYCRYYRTWLGMLTRCYSAKSLEKRPSYLNTKVCKEWLTFSNFKAWMEKQKWEGKELDKDIIGNGDLYSPETCIFVSPKLNSCVINLKKPDVVSRGNRFHARCSNPVTGKREHLGYFSNKDQAVKVWFSRKRQIIIELLTDEGFAKPKEVAEKLMLGGSGADGSTSRQSEIGQLMQVMAVQAAKQLQVDMNVQK